MALSCGVNPSCRFAMWLNLVLPITRHEPAGELKLQGELCLERPILGAIPILA